MTTNALKKHIRIRKRLLNFLLNYFSPTNKFIVFLSQNLDMLVTKRQRSLYIKHKNKHTDKYLKSKTNLQKINNYRNIA